MTFLSTMWQYRDRLFPVRGESPQKLYELAELGIEPDLIFFDSNKTGEDIEVAHSLFPHAILTGDDWTWGSEEQGYPIQAPVKTFASSHNYRLITRAATWVLVRPFEIREIESNLRQLGRQLKHVLRRLI
jgi:hypothetical protein